MRFNTLSLLTLALDAEVSTGIYATKVLYRRLHMGRGAAGRSLLKLAIFHGHRAVHRKQRRQRSPGSCSKPYSALVSTSVIRGLATKINAGRSLAVIGWRAARSVRREGLDELRVRDARCLLAD